MKRPGRGRQIDREQRTVSGLYFNLACRLVGVSQEEVARRAGVSSSTLSRSFSGDITAKREKLLAWGDILLDLCPQEHKEFLLGMEAEMLHTIGYATRNDEQQGVERFPYYQKRVLELLADQQTDS